MLESWPTGQCAGDAGCLVDGQRSSRYVELHARSTGPWSRNVLDDSQFDDGAAGVSGLTLSEIDIYFKALTIKDFEERSDSSYTLVGDKFNLMPPSIQNPVAISSSSGTIGGSIVVQDTTYFPSEGYLFTSGGTVIQYTGKTTTEFTGCTLYNGPNSINATEELIPFTI